MVWKVEAQGDTIYIEAETIDEAEKKFVNSFGNVPKKLVTWTKVDAIPDDEEAI